MSKNSNSRAAAPARKGGSMLAAVLIGMVLGLILAGGVAWYILKRPNPFSNNVPHEEVKLTPDPVKPPAEPVAKTEPEGASGVADDKPRFEFYKVLTDKPDSNTTTQTPEKSAGKAVAKEKGPYFLQAGAFSSADEADKLKAKLAMLGVEASVQSTTLPDKSVWHRVRLGPYKSPDEVSKVSALLKQNGVTPTRVQ